LQEQVIQSLLNRHNTVIPTGGGKSVISFQLWFKKAQQLSPLIALMKNQVDAIRSLSSRKIAHVLNSSLTKTEIAQVKKDISSGLTKLLCCSWIVNKEENVNFLKNDYFFVAIDEAHCQNGAMISGGI
jgi:ATP-dependent DNA helicase RecQ